MKKKKEGTFLSVWHCGKGGCVGGFVVLGIGSVGQTSMIQLHIPQIIRACKLVK